MDNKPSNHHKKCFLTEENTSLLLQRYSATTVLELLQEVAGVEEVKIDWNKMVRKSRTGITNAREYQMLWRHLAYQDSFLDGVDYGAQPLDDDSDLECELEVFPAVSAETSADAAACVKVLVASASNAHGANGSIVEAPLTINIPQSHASCASSANHEFSSSMRGKNITVPISLRKQPLPSGNGSENLDINGNLGNKRKRKTWTEQEDQELVEVVRKHGEGNWANLIKGPFKTDRTPSQLSQRWTILKKKQGNINLGVGPQLSEVQLATSNAVLHALGDNLKPLSSVKAGTSSHVASMNNVHPSAAELLGSQSRAQSQQDPSPSAVQCPTMPGTSKSRVPNKKPPTIMSVSPDSMVKAAAVAAGARIATPSDAASLRMAAQSKNAVHIKSGGGSMMKPSMPGNSNQLPSNVHFIRTGLVNKPLPAHASMSNPSRLGSSQEVPANSVKPEIPAVQSNPDDVILGLGASSQVINGVASNDASAGNVAIVPVNINNTDVVSSTLIPEAVGNQTVSSSPTGQDQMDHQSSIPGNSLNENLDDRKPTLGTEVKEHM